MRAVFVPQGPGTPRPFFAALRRQPNSTEKSVIATIPCTEQRPFKTPQLPAPRAVVREPAPQKRRFFLLLLLSSLGKRPGGRKQAVSALAEQRPKTGPKPPGGAGMLSLPEGGHTAPHTAKQGLFSLSPAFGPRTAQKVGPGFRPDRRSSGGAESDKVGQALCLPRPRGGTFICHRISQNTPCSIMASATRLKPAMFAPATRS